MAYRKWATAGLIVSVVLSLIALALAAILTFGLYEEFTGSFNSVDTWLVALSVFFYAAAVMPFWAARIFWKVNRHSGPVYRDERLLRSARRLILAILLVMGGVTFLELAAVGPGGDPVFIVFLALQWSPAVVTIGLLMRLMAIPSPIGLEESVADRF